MDRGGVSHVGFGTGVPAVGPQCVGDAGFGGAFADGLGLGEAQKIVMWMGASNQTDFMVGGVFGEGGKRGACAREYA